MNMPKKQKRIVIYVSEEDYKTFRWKLLSLGKTVSGWFREQMTAFLKDH